MITDKETYNRRKFLTRSMGFVGISALLAGCNSESATNASGVAEEVILTKDRGMSTLKQYKSYSNAYEFGTGKSDPGNQEDNWNPADPWNIDIDGTTHTLDEVRGVPFADLPSEDFNFRCVEAWGMRVNYNGYSLSSILNRFGDTSKKFVTFTCVEDDSLPNQGGFSSFNWPYKETYTMEEAMNPLCWAVFGNYGAPSKANGAPFRINAPWMYGYASPKFVVKIDCSDEFTEGTWGRLSAREYGGSMKLVDPNSPHPRWSQATHRHITAEGTTRVPTELFNGYADMVKHMYPEGDFG